MLQCITDKCNELQAALTISLIDSTKAFDITHRPSLWNILQAYGIPPKAVIETEQTYMNSVC